MSNRYAVTPSPPAVAILARIVALCALLALAGGAASAQFSSFGRHFIVAFPDTTQSHVRVLVENLEPTVTLSLVSFDTATVTVSGPSYLRTVTVTPERTTTVTLTEAPRPSRIFVDSLNTPLPASFDIRSDRPVAVTAYFTTRHGTEAYTPIPVERWGREYFAASLNQWFVYNALSIEEKYTFVAAPAAAVVIASEDGTDVTIETTTAVVGPATRTVTLNAGQAYLLETAVPGRLDSLAKPDLSGTRITATRPIGVISGNTRTLGSIDNPIPVEPLPTNSMSNAAFEWLHPVEAHGHTFIYRQYSAVDELTTTELIRVYGTSPGTTTVTTTNGGPPMSLVEGGYLEFSSRAWRPSDSLEPFAVRTDRPAQAFVFTGSTARLIGNDPQAGVEMETHAWSPAMAELTPRERWITLGRYNAPSYPGAISHYLVLAADSGTTLLVDGQPIAWDARPVTGTTYHHARIDVGPGDHTIRAIGGRFTANAFGQRRGYAAFRPFRANGGDDPPGGIAHPTYYLEILGIAYAMPVPGVSDLVPTRDSLVIARVDRCDSTVVVTDRIGVTWSSAILDAALDPGARNVDVDIARTFVDKLHIGFRVRFRPVDPSADASASVTVWNEAGQRWTIPYEYRASTVALTPSSVDLLAIPAGESRTIPLTLTNEKPFTTTVLDVRLRDGTQGFTLLGREVLPKPLASGGSFGLTLEFTGAEPGRHYVDTLVIHADCDSSLVPISARTAPPDPEPVPLITGYDWGTRRVGSVNDTLSFISNAGTLPFTVARIEILNDPLDAFDVDEAAVPGLPVVEPAARHAVGISFTPPSEGSFVADILLITTDNDSARAILRGASELATIAVSDLVLAEVCLDRALDTLVGIEVGGSRATRIDSFVVASSPGVSIALDTASMALPRVVASGETLPLRMRVTGMAQGAFTATVVAIAEATGDSVANISGTVVDCPTLGVVATDHDFGNVLVTRTAAGTVQVINTGEAEVTVRSMRIVDDVEGSFRVLGPATPLAIAPGAAVTVDVDFTPGSVGAKSARVEYETTAGIVHSRLTGTGVVLVVPAHIPRTYHGEPGDERRVAVVLDSSIAVAPSVPIPVVVEYDPDLLDFVALHDTAAAQAALRLVASEPGRVSLELVPHGDSLFAGPVAALRFLVRITLADSSELPLSMTSPMPWLSFVTSPGLFVRDPWCGLAERLFEFTSGTLVLRPVQPNPVRSEARIEFGVPLDGDATLVVVDALGAERLRLIDGHLAAGTYAATIPSGTLDAGVYLVRLASSGMQLVERFVVE